MKYLKILSLVFISAIFFTGCVDQEFDSPPFTENGDDPQIDESKIKSMSDVKALSGSGDITEIIDDIYVKGIVISDDKSGNFYKVLYLQDEVGTGGLQFSIDASELHATYPLFRRVFVSLKGLYVGKSNGAWTIGIKPDGDLVGRIPQALVETYLLPGTFNIPFTPEVLRIDQIEEEKHGNTLITINELQFPDASLNGTYADAVGKNSVNHDLVDCDENMITLRNSGYADFAAETVPTGNGAITGVFSIYESFQKFEQLFVSSTADIDFSGNRCGNTSTGNEDLISIADLRTAFSSSESNVADLKKIRGIVISDQEHGNDSNSQNIVVQDGTGGIEVRFTSDHSFNLNDDVEIVVSNIEYNEYKGTLQLNNVQLGSASIKGSGVVVPRITTIQELLNNSTDWQSTLIKIEGATIESGTFEGNKNIEDATANMTLRTSDYASFSSESVPSGEVTVVGILSNFEGADQVKMRNRADVTGGGTSGSDELFKDDFEGGLDAWETVSLIGDQEWETVTYGNPGSCAKMSGHIGGASGTDHENEDWLISSAIDASAVSSAVLVFENATNYSGKDMEVYVSTDYSGTGSPASGSWDALSYAKSSGDWEWIASGEIDLSAYVGGDIYIAFKYISDGSESSTWEIDNLVVK